MRLPIFAVLCLLVTGCTCGESLRRTTGELTAGLEGGEEAAAGQTLEVGFGDITMDETSSVTLLVSNHGRGPLTVHALEVLEGSASNQESEGAVFTVDLAPGTTLPGGEVRRVAVQFRPRSEEPDADQFFSARVRIVVEGTKPGAEWVELELKGNGLAEACGVPARLDFGAVWTGTSWDLPLVLSNPAQSQRTAEIFNINGEDAASFSFAEGGPGAFPLASGASLTSSIEFRPTQARDYVAYLLVKRSEKCHSREVELVGQGVEEAIVGKPNPLDCGHIPVGLSKDVTLSLVNLGHEPAVVSDLRLTGSDFTWAQPPGEVSLAPEGGSAALTVRCTPHSAGAAQGQVLFATSLPRQPSGAVPVVLWGGGPDIEVQPRAVDFGDVAFVAKAHPPVPQKRTLMISNVGDPVRDSSGNLYLGKLRKDGRFGEPYAAIRPLNSNTVASEFSVRLSSAYQDADGLSPTADQNSVQMEVALIPQSQGPKAAELIIYSNDLDEPEVTVQLSAEALVLPECNYSVSTTSLDFGTVAHPGEKVLQVTVYNKGTDPGDVCMLSAISLTPSSDAVFELDSAPPSATIDPGGSLLLNVVFRPDDRPGSWNHHGEVEFFLSSSSNPRAIISLQGRSGSQCLTLIPTIADFGETKVGCRSPAKPVQAYNGCIYPIELVNYQMVDPAATPPNLGSCAGPGPCDAFSFTGGPSLVDGGVVMAPGSAAVNFTVGFAPERKGLFAGTARFDVIERDAGVTYSFALAGDGVATGGREDVFNQNPFPRLDLLVSYEPLPYIEPVLWQYFDGALADLSADLIRRGIDFHVGVTQMKTATPWNINEPGVRGELIEPVDGGTRFVTSSVPDLYQALENRTYIRDQTQDTGGSQCFESLYLTTTPPMSDGGNAGFLRADAPLAVICWSTRYDISANRRTPPILPVMDWYNSLLTIKGAAHPDRIHVLAVTKLLQGSTSCPAGPSPRPDLASRYPQMAALTQGRVVELCNPGWYEGLSEAVGAAAGIRSVFPLTGVPDAPSSLQVLVDGAAISNIDATGETVWTFDAGANEVSFAASHVPPPGSEIRIRYSQSCN